MTPILSLLLASFVPALTPTSSDPACPGWSQAFGPGGIGGAVHDLQVFDDGAGPALYAGGAFASAGNVVASGVARWDGQSWSAVGAFQITVANARYVRALAVLDEGAGARLFAAGSFVQVDGQAARGVARWDGAGWNTLGGGPPVDMPSDRLELLALTVFDVGAGPELFVGGTLQRGASNFVYLARWDGASWWRISGGAQDVCPPDDPWCFESGVIHALATFDDGHGAALYAAGRFSHVDGQIGRCLARWDGATWSAPGGDFGFGTSEGSSLAVHDDGQGPALYVAGSLAGGVRRWDGSTMSYLGSGPAVGALRGIVSSPPVPGFPAGLWAFAVGPNATAGVHTLRLSSWDGAQWSDIATPFPFEGSDSTYGLEPFDDGSGMRLHLGGSFQLIGADAVANVAAFDGASWSGLGTGEGLDGPQPYFAGHVGALVVHDRGAGPELFVGGNLRTAGGSAVAGVVRLQGSAWEGVPGLQPTTDVDVAAFASAGAGGPLYLAGYLSSSTGGSAAFMRWTGSGFVPVAGSPYAHVSEGHDIELYDEGQGPIVFGLTGSIYRWNGSSLSWWTSSYPTASGIRGLTVIDDGSGAALYAHGTFDGIRLVQEGINVPAEDIARWDGQQWTAVAPGANDLIEAIAWHDDGSGPRLFAAGRFTSAGGVAASRIAAWNGSTWSSVGGGLGGVGATVNVLARFDDGRGDGTVLYAGGRFSTAGGAPAANLARWDGVSWSAVDLATSGIDPTVRTLLALDIPSTGRALAVGGDFDGVAGVASSHFALLPACDQTGRLFCFGDGSSGACPCGNTSAPGDRAGCRHSFGQGGTLRARGRASLADDSLELDGGAMTDSWVLYFQAATRTAGIPFGDGIKCTAGPFVRLGTKTNVGGASSYPAPGDASISQRGFVLAPGTRHYQARYRNAAEFCTPEGFNYTNAVTIVWGL